MMCGRGAVLVILEVLRLELGGWSFNEAVL